MYYEVRRINRSTPFGAVNVPQKIVHENELNLRFKNPLECHLISSIILIMERTV